MASAAAVTVASTQLLTTSLSRVAAAPAGSVSSQTVRAATASRASAACSRARSDPAANTSSCPASAGWRVPSTGASTRSRPLASAKAASSVAAATPTVEVCSQTWPSASPAWAVFMAASTAGPSVSMVMITSASRTASAAVAATVAPDSASGAALSWLRFQTRTSRPARRRLRAMPAPMIPVPRTATTGALTGHRPRSAASPMLGGRLS